MSEEKVTLNVKLEGYPAQMFKYIKRRLGHTHNYEVLIELITDAYEKQKEREAAKP